MKQDDLNHEENLTALSALIGELIARRWIRQHAGEEIPSANVKTPIDRICKKSTMRARGKVKRVKPSCKIGSNRTDVSNSAEGEEP